MSRTFSTLAEHPKWTLTAITIIPRAALLAAGYHHGTPFGDTAHDGYLQIAQNIVQHHEIGLGPRHLITRGPLYPLLLAPGVAFGHAQLWNALLNLVASVATCLLVFSAARQLTRSLSGAFYAAAFVTLDPWLIWFVKNPMTTETATLFVAATVYFFVQILLGRRLLASSVGLGASCAVAALDHPALIVLSGGFTLALLVTAAGSWRSTERKPILRNSALSLAAMWLAFTAVLIPYAIRNDRDVGRPVLISDGAGLSYFMGASRYTLSPYPWANVSWPFTDVADRLHVSVPDLDVQYFTLDDRYYPELSKLAKADIESLALHHPAYLAKRTAVMSLWFLVGDYSVSRTLAHCIYLALLGMGCWACWRTQGWQMTLPFLVIILPALALHSLTMALIGHAAYAIPYVVPLAMPLAFALAKQPVPAMSFIRLEKLRERLMALNNVQAIVFDVDGTLYPQRPLRMRILYELAAQFVKKPASQLRTLKVLRAYRKAHELARTNRSDDSAKRLQLYIAAELSGEHPEFVERSVREWFQHRPLRHLKAALYPDLLALLRQAKSHGIRLGVLSDYPAADKLRAMGIIEYFDAIVSSHDESVGYLKPHPLGLQTCLQQLSVQPGESLYVGDRADVDLPCAASAHTQFVLFGKPPNRAGCLAVSSYQQLSRALGFQS